MLGIVPGMVLSLIASTREYSDSFGSDIALSPAIYGTRAWGFGLS